MNERASSPALQAEMWQLAVEEDATDWSEENPDQVQQAWGEWTELGDDVGQVQDWRTDEQKPPQEEQQAGLLLPARLWPEDDTEPVVYHHAGYRYKRTIDPARVVVGYIGDFGKDVPYLTRSEMMQAVRNSVRFCEQWLYTFVIHVQLPNSYRLRRNMRRRTREPRYQDLLEYERYLRWNVEYRFLKVAVFEVKAALANTKMPLDHFNIVLAYLF